MSKSLFNRQLWCGVLASSLSVVACEPCEERPRAVSCEDIKASGLPLERDHVLYQNADASRPYVAYCAEDGGTYLTLPSGPANNYSQKLNVSGHSVITQWNRVRLDPQTLTIDTTDFRFSTSTGHIPEWDVSNVRYGSAGDCVRPESTTGRAGVDLTGTPFAITATWQTAGAAAAGSIKKSANNQAVEISGGGFCGDMAVNGPMTLGYLAPLPR